MAQATQYLRVRCFNERSVTSAWQGKLASSRVTHTSLAECQPVSPEDACLDLCERLSEDEAPQGSAATPSLPDCR